MHEVIDSRDTVHCYTMHNTRHIDDSLVDSRMGSWHIDALGHSDQPTSTLPLHCEYSRRYLE